MFKTRALLLPALLIVLLASGNRATPAAAASVTMTVTANFNGHFKYGEWLPLRVSLANDGPPVRAEIRADTTTAGAQAAYVTPVELPTGARKQITLYVQPPSFARALRLRLMDGERELDVQTIAVTVERNVDFLVGVVAPRMQGFTGLVGLTLNPTAENPALFMKGMSQTYARSVKMLPMPLADIPDRPEGMRLLDAVIISGVDTSELTADQGLALQGWVEQGGRLILGGGASAARTLAGLPDGLASELRPVGNTTDLTSLAALGTFAGENIRLAGPFPVTWSPARVRPIVEQDGNALLVEKRVQQGYVDYSALDLAGSPFDAWAGAGNFWSKVLTPGSAFPAGAPVDVSQTAARGSSMQYALQSLPSLEIPSIGWLAALLGVYVLLVGPVNYIVLRRMRRLAWGWVTIPALTLAFSAGAFGFAYSLRGGDVILNKISVIPMGADNQASMQSYVGIFSPERTAYTLSFPGNTLVAPLAPEVSGFGGGGAAALASTVIVEGERTLVRGVQINQWAMQGFRAESRLPQGWSIDADLTVDGDRVRGTLVNRTDQAITDAVLVNGSRYLKLGDLEAGKSKTLDDALSSPNPGPPFPYYLFQFAGGPQPRESQMRQQILQNYYQSYGGPSQPPSSPTLIGWMRGSPLDVQVENTRWATQQTSLVVATLDLSYRPGPIHVAAGDLQAQVAESTGGFGSCGNNQFSVNGGTLVLAFRLPDALAAMQVTRMGLVIQAGDMPTVEIADKNGEWVKVDSPRTGRNELTDPGQFVSADGAIRLRLSADANPRGGCDQFDLDIEGELTGDK